MNKLILIISLIAFKPVAGSDGRDWKAQAFRTSNCTGPVVKEDNKKLWAYPSDGPNSLRFNGLWDLSICRAVAGSKYCVDDPNVRILDTNISCYPINVANLEHVFASRTPGDNFSDGDDQSEPVLTLWSQIDLYGKSDYYDNRDNTTRLVQFQSYLIQGIRSWNVYSRPGYQGHTRCLAPSKEVMDRGWGLTVVNQTELFKMGSVEINPDFCGGGSSGGMVSVATMVFSLQVGCYIFLFSSRY